MKPKLLFVFIPLFCIVFSLNGQNVSKEVEKKGILIENFTGIHCGFCPDGHAIIHDILSIRPGKAYAMSIHAGYYAVAYPDEPDFIVEDGVTIHDWFGASGYPSGMVNRTIFDTYLVTGRGDWAKDSKAINSEDAPVNIYLESAYDGNTRILTVNVELYYTADVEQDANYLSIAYTEGNILGPQSGANMGSNYSHQHMLRGYISDVWGDVIENPAKGTFVEKTYTFTLPEYINEVPVTPSGIELVAFVTADKTNILNVTGGKPTYTNYEVPTDATLSHPDFIVSSEARITRSYVYNYFDVYLENKGSAEIQNADFAVTINGNTQTAAWEGSIPPFETRPITIDVNDYPIEQSNTYSIQLVSVNGQTLSGNTLNGTFDGAAACTPKMTVEIQTDYFADENRFLIKTRDGEIVKEFGPYPVGTSAIYKEEVELDRNTTYCFEILDEWGDGMKDTARGYLKLYNDDNSLFYLTYDITGWGLRIPIETSKFPMSVTPVDNASYAYLDKTNNTLNLKIADDRAGNIGIGLYNIDGKKLFGTEVAHTSGTVSIPVQGIPAGVYLIRITDNTRTEIIKILVY